MPEENEYIYGLKPVEEFMETRPDKIEKIFIRNNLQISKIQHIKNYAISNEVPIVRVPGKKLYDLVGRVNDQGIVAQISVTNYLQLIEWLQEQDIKNNLGVLVLDGIEDPHNTGAIIRAGAAAGIHAIVVPKHGQSPINATVHKTSAGTIHKVPIIRSHDTNQAIVDLKSAGFFIVGLSGEAQTSIWEIDYKRSVAFIIGNEGTGIQQSTRNKCDLLAYIPMENQVESLNASVSAALVSYEWKRKS